MEDIWKAVVALMILAAAYSLYRIVNRLIDKANKQRWKNTYTTMIRKEKEGDRDRRWYGGRR